MTYEALIKVHDSICAVLNNPELDHGQIDALSDTLVDLQDEAAEQGILLGSMEPDEWPTCLAVA